MKKRMISMIAAFALTVSAMPLSAMAASMGKNASNSITDVKTHITLTGTRYITYNFNGMTVDSRNVGASWNRNAFEMMTESDKHKVSRWYLPGADRTEQFGDGGVQTLMDYINDSSGWSHAWKVMKDKIGNKYLKELRPYYGGGEDAGDDSNSYYNKEIERLTTFDEGTAAYEVLTKYPYYEESGELFAMYGSIPEMMKVGKAGYDTCVNAYYQTISAGTKAMSTYTLNLIVDNCIVPGTFAAPSATLSGVRTAGYTLILSARNNIRDSVNKITGYSETYIDEVAREAVAGGSGTSPDEAVKVLRAQQKIIDENYQLAKYCHEECVKFRNAIESRAQSVLDEIEKNKEKSTEDYYRRQQEETDRHTAAMPDTTGISRSNTYYSRIMAKRPTADPDKEPEKYEQQRIAWEKEAQACIKELDNEFSSWKNSAASDLAGVMRSMGYEAVIGTGLPEVEVTNEMIYYNIDGSKYNNYNGLPDWMEYYWEGQNMENFYETTYASEKYNYDDEAMQDIEAEANAAVAKYEIAISKRDGSISELESLAGKHEREFESLYAKAKGINEAWGLGLSSYDGIGANVISRDVLAADLLYDHKDSYYVDYKYNPSGGDYYRVKIDKIKANVALLNELRAEYKKDFEEVLDDYVRLQSADDALNIEWNEIVKERNELLDSAPDYVKEQELNYYTFRYISYVDPDLYTLKTGTGGPLRDMINKAAENIEYDDNYYNNYQKAKNAVLKKEADKLEPIYEKLRDLDRRMSYINDAEYGISKAMSRVRWHNALDDENLDAYGITDHKGLHIGTKTETDSSWYTEEYDKEKRAMKLLISDFRGTGSLQMDFMQAYGNYKAKRSSATRAVSAGMMTYDNFKKEIYDPLSGAYFNMVRSSSVPTYAGPNINIGEDSETELKAMYEDEDCEVQQTLEIAENPESYVPVEGIASETVQLMSVSELNEGGSTQLSVTVSPANATFPKVKWESLSPEIAGVDENGRVTAYSEGEAVIRAVAEDAPLTEVTDEDGNVTGYETPDEFVVEFTVNVSSQYTYDEIGNTEEEGETESNPLDTGYSWANYGTEEEPRYTSVTTDGDTTTVSARFNSNGDGSVAVMAVYDTDGRLIGASIVNNNDLLRELSVSFDKDKQADRVKIFTWFSTQSLQSYSDVIIEEKII